MASKTRTRKPRLSRDQVAAEALRNALTEPPLAAFWGGVLAVLATPHFFRRKET
jgi:hypothetical protein